MVDGHFCCINRYTSDTRCVTALQSYTAIQRYTLYNLYNTPLRASRPPDDWVRKRVNEPGECY